MSVTQVTIYISNINSQILVLGDSGEALDYIGCAEDEDEEEKLLKQAIALSLEGAEENDNGEEDNIGQGVDDDGNEASHCSPIGR